MVHKEGAGFAASEGSGENLELCVKCVPLSQAYVRCHVLKYITHSSHSESHV